jgi:hypothetical protein
VLDVATGREIVAAHSLVDCAIGAPQLGGDLFDDQQLTAIREADTALSLILMWLTMQ